VEAEADEISPGSINRRPSAFSIPGPFFLVSFPSLRMSSPVTSSMRSGGLGLFWKIECYEKRNTRIGARRAWPFSVIKLQTLQPFPEKKPRSSPRIGDSLAAADFHANTIRIFPSSSAVTEDAGGTGWRNTLITLTTSPVDRFQHLQHRYWKSLMGECPSDLPIVAAIECDRCCI
jgi:hypothetical protein